MNRPSIPERLFLYIGFLVFFVFTLASNFSGPHDSIGYLNGIVKGSPLFHQHHLLYHFTAHYWLVFTQMLFPGVKDFYLVELFTALWGSGSMVIVYSFFRHRFNFSGVLSFLSTTVIAFSYGIWFYSVNIEVYAPPMFFLLLALYILTKRDFTKKDVWKVIVLHCFAILFHQVNILFIPIILYCFWRNRKKINLPVSLLQYIIIGIVLVGGAYFIVGWMVEGQDTVAKWVRWLEGYAADEDYWEPLSMKTPINATIGYAHAILGGHYIFRVPGIEDWINRTLPQHSLHDEMFLGRKISPVTAIILTTLSLVLGILMLLMVVRFVKKFRTIRAKLGHVIGPLLISWVIYSAFFCFWMPEILEFWLLQTVWLWLMLIGVLSITGFPLKLKAATGIGILSLLLLVINYFGSIRWILDIDNDLYYEKTEPVKDEASSKDLIILQDGWIIKDFLTYYTRADVEAIPFKDTARARLNNAVTRCINGGGRIFIYTEDRNMKKPASEPFIDSLLNVYNSRRSVFRKSNPEILVIQ